MSTQMTDFGENTVQFSGSCTYRLGVFSLYCIRGERGLYVRYAKVDGVAFKTGGLFCMLNNVSQVLQRSEFCDKGNMARWRFSSGGNCVGIDRTNVSGVLNGQETRVPQRRTRVHLKHR